MRINVPSTSTMWDISRAWFVYAGKIKVRYFLNRPCMLQEDVKFIKTLWLWWYGHAEKMPNQTAKATMEGTRTSGKSCKWWRDKFEEDLNIIGLKNRRARSRECQEWRKIVLEAMAVMLVETEKENEKEDEEEEEKKCYFSFFFLQFYRASWYYHVFIYPSECTIRLFQKC